MPCVSPIQTIKIRAAPGKSVTTAMSASLTAARSPVFRSVSAEDTSLCCPVAPSGSGMLCRKPPAVSAYTVEASMATCGSSACIKDSAMSVCCPAAEMPAEMMCSFDGSCRDD